MSLADVAGDDLPASARSRCEAFAGLAGVLAIATGALVLAGWAGDIDAFKRVFPGLVAMNPVTAVAFMLAGGSLWWQRRALDRTGPAVIAARLAAVAVAVLGALRLAGYLLGWDVGVDQWLFAERLDGAPGERPNRMAPNTALALLLLGLGLLLIDAKTARHHRPADWLAVPMLLLSLLAIFGYAYRVPELYGLTAYIPMAFHTALLAGLLALGLLCARPRHGLMALATGDSLGGRELRRLLPVAVVTLFVLGWLRLEGERRGLYGAELGVALYTVANIVLFSVLVWWSAGALHRAERERSRAEAVRDHALALNRLIMDNSLDVICAIDGDGRFVEVSAASTALWGYTPAELVGRHYAELVHPDDRARSAATAAAVTAGQPTLDFNNRYLRKDGRAIDLDWTASWSQADGLMFCVARDATRRVEAEELLRQNQAQTRAIIDTAHDAFIAIDRSGMIIDWNASAEAMFGWPRAEALGRRLSATIVPPQYRQAHDRGLDHYLATGEGPVLNKPIELSALHRDGREFPIELTIWPVSSGASTTFNAFVRDISERRQAEGRIQALNAELQQSNRELEAFSYTVSHDLRAPLRHIDGYARMLHEDALDRLDDDSRRYLDEIGAAARRMGALIDDLLAFSRLGRKPVERVAVDMRQLVARVVREAGGGDRVVLGDLPPAHADPVLLRQVWTNLVSNALKYSAPRGGDARVGIDGEHVHDRVEYRIRDNGVGFDMRFADKLFGVFQRLHSQDEFEGTGVGLAIVQQIVARHGGSIRAQSEPGRGATFTFDLPAVEHDAGDTDAREDAA